MSGKTLSISATQPQADFLTLKAKYRLFCAGLGAGKSETMCSAAMIDASQGADVLVGCYAPTFDLIRLITAPRLQSKLNEHGVSYHYNKAENIIYTSAPGFGDFVLRTMDNPERIVGYETYTAHVDELDTLKTEHARTAWHQIIARNRQRPTTIKDPYNQASAYTTPEGFKFCHERWVSRRTESYEMIQAATYSNPYLPSDYIDSLRESYPEELVEAYIEGRFVNLTAGTVYHMFGRELNNTDAVEQRGEHLHIGMDFNVQNMGSVIHVVRDGDPYAVGELSGVLDTPAMIDLIKDRYPEHKITVYPDASGSGRKTVDASTNDLALLRQAGFSVVADKANPSVRSRVLAMCSAFCNAEGRRRYKVNVKRCPAYVECLEQQAYDKHGAPDKTQGLDHLNDASGYFIVKRFPIVKPASIGLVKFTMSR